MPYTFSFSDTSVIFTFYLYFFVVDSEFFFFFKQKTAYELRISDWSSDVCSSDLVESASLALNTPAARLIARGEERFLLLDEVEALQASKALVVDACRHVVRDAGTAVSLARRPVLFALARDRKSGVEGKSVSVRVDLGGRRIINKKNKYQLS